MRYAVVDDEPIAHHILAGYAEQLPFLEHVGSCFTTVDALELLRRERVELLFLDIQLPRLSGFDLLRSLVRPPLVIAVTAHREYALEGWDLSVCDYLLKPFSFERFVRAVNKAQAARGDGGAAKGAEAGIFFKDGKKFRQVRPEEIRWIEASGNFSLVHLDQGRFLTQEKLSELAVRLPQLLVRVHKSYLVPIHRIDVVAGDVVRLGAQELPVGRVYKANLVRLITERR